MRAKLQVLCTKKNISIVSIVAIVIGASLASYNAGIYVEKAKYTSFLSTFRNVRENSDKYKFINPLIGGVSAPATDVGIYSDIESDIVDYLKSEINKKNLYGYSFYFRDLTSGLWFGSNESANFAPASLFKLPIAIAIYKQIENDSGLLQKKLLYTQELSDINTVKQLNSDSTLVVGQLYAVDELVEKMLVYSDNGAKNLLLSVIDKKYLDQLLNLVNFSNNPNNTTYDISSRKYANFLRIVYGSSYINEEHSEYILSLLARSDFKDGIVAGLPSTVTVAHKYGVYEFPEQIEGKEVLTVQLHDCGVVYHQSNPYVFCLMTKGKDDASLFKIISTVSRMMYKHQEVYAGGDI